jgi:hypothetical protein
MKKYESIRKLCQEFIAEKKLNLSESELIKFLKDINCAVCDIELNSENYNNVLAKFYK